MFLNKKMSMTRLLSIVFAGFLTLFILTKCGSGSKNFTKSNEISKTKKKKLENENFPKCPDSVKVYPQSYGLIVTNWSEYAPSTNTVYSILVVPHSLGAAVTRATDTSNTGSVQLENFGSGAYTVYYTIQPGSSTYGPCAGVANLSFS